MGGRARPRDARIATEPASTRKGRRAPALPRVPTLGAHRAGAMQERVRLFERRTSAEHREYLASSTEVNSPFGRSLECHQASCLPEERLGPLEGVAERGPAVLRV